MSGIYDRFTERARRVVIEAQEQARGFAHNYIGTEHLLLALADDQDGIAGKALTSLGVPRERIHTAVARIIGSGEQAADGRLVLTPRTSKVLELAPHEALAMGHPYVGTEHILLGLMRENSGVASRILDEGGVSPERVRGEVGRLLSGSAKPELKDIAIGKLSTRESLIREIQERVKAELVSDYGKERGRVLNGALGEQIAIAAGSLNLTSYVTPEQVAEGICNWLDKYFLPQSTPSNGPREGTEDPLPPPCSGGGDGSRVAALDSHCPFCGQGVAATAERRAA